MPENILVVEYEPRYTDRVRQALAGQPFSMTFAKDGEEAIRALDSHPRLIVLSSVVPKVSANEIIRAIRDRKYLEGTPILLTVSGYTGSSPQQDAARMGASDILPKPYSETDLLGKIRQMIGGGADEKTQQLTSNELFGDLVDDSVVHAAPKKSATSDVDKLLEQTLGGMMPKKTTASRTPVPTAPGTASVPRPKTAPGAGGDFEKKLQDTLSGIEKSARKVTSPGTVPAPAPHPPAQAAPAPAAEAKPAATPASPQPPAAPPAARPAAAAPAARPASTPPPAQAFSPKPGGEKVPVSQPVITPAAAAPGVKEDEEPTDGIRFGQYVLLDKIATGGMAEVWKARMKGVEGFQKIVAIKKILPHLSDNQDFIEMFVDEAKLAAQLNHNNIIHIYDLGKIGNSYYIAMEYVDGHDLKTILRRGADRDQPMNVELALFIASKIAAALDYAHRKRDFDEKEMGLVHRDVSPQNVLISQEGDIKLCDFGIAKAASKASHTQAGALKGKLQYMSPEQAWGKNIDRRSDIFALATVLFEMLANRKLFTGENEMSILEQVREARVIPPSQVNDDVTPEIDRIVLKALQKDPENRYQTAGEMARDIDSVLYSFRPTPTSADLAIYMHRIWVEQAPPRHEAARLEEELSAAPTLIETDLARIAPKVAVAPALAAAPAAAAPAPAPAPAPVAMPAWEASPAVSAPEPKKRSAALPIAAAVVVLLLAGAGGWYYFTQRGAAPKVATTASAPATATTAPVAAAVPSAVDTAATMTTATTASAVPVPGTQAPVLDPNLVAQEVQKRLAAERARLEEEQRRSQQPPAQASRPAPALSTQAPPQTATQQATATVAPPVPVPEPTATTATQAAVDTAPAAPQFRAGDLVPAGTEGLVLPRITRRGTVPYPPIARAQRVQGTVLVSVLVSESGQVIQTRVIRGIARGVGLNEAAEEIMRRSTFSSPTLNGMRVKAWTTERVDFKL